jgi:hypothetical protein
MRMIRLAWWQLVVVLIILTYPSIMCFRREGSLDVGHLLFIGIWLAVLLSVFLWPAILIAKGATATQALGASVQMSETDRLVYLVMAGITIMVVGMLTYR